MRVSILAGLPVASSAYSEHKARVATPFHQLFGGGVVHRVVSALCEVAAARERLNRLQPFLVECNSP